MFFAQNLLCRKGCLAKAWIAATYSSRLNKKAVLRAHLVQLCSFIAHPSSIDSTQSLNLRLQAILLWGVCDIHRRKSKYLLIDAQEVQCKMKFSAVHTRNLDLHTKGARREAITLPEQLLELLPLNTIDISLGDPTVLDLAIDRDAKIDLHSSGTGYLARGKPLPTYRSGTDRCLSVGTPSQLGTVKAVPPSWFEPSPQECNFGGSFLDDTTMDAARDSGAGVFGVPMREYQEFELPAFEPPPPSQQQQQQSDIGPDIDEPYHPDSSGKRADITKVKERQGPTKRRRKCPQIDIQVTLDGDVIRRNLLDTSDIVRKGSRKRLRRPLPDTLHLPHYFLGQPAGTFDDHLIRTFVDGIHHHDEAVKKRRGREGPHVTDSGRPDLFQGVKKSLFDDFALAATDGHAPHGGFDDMDGFEPPAPVFEAGMPFPVEDPERPRAAFEDINDAERQEYLRLREHGALFLSPQVERSARESLPSHLEFESPLPSRIRPSLHSSHFSHLSSIPGDITLGTSPIAWVDHSSIGIPEPPEVEVSTEQFEIPEEDVFIQPVTATDAINEMTWKLLQHIRGFTSLGSTTFADVMEGADRGAVARAFVRLLVLKTHGTLDVSQDQPYGDMTIVMA